MAKVNVMVMVDRAIERNVTDGRLRVMQTAAPATTANVTAAPTETMPPLCPVKAVAPNAPTQATDQLSPLPEPHTTCKGANCTEADHSIIIRKVNGKWISTPYCKAIKAVCPHPEHIKSIWYEHTSTEEQPDHDGFRAAFREYAKTLSVNKLYVVDLETRYPDIYAKAKAAHETKDAATTLPEYQKALDTLVELYTHAARRAGHLD